MKDSTEEDKTKWTKKNKEQGRKESTEEERWTQEIEILKRDFRVDFFSTSAYHHTQLEF